MTVESARLPIGSRTAEEVGSKIAPPPRAVIDGTHQPDRPYGAQQQQFKRALPGGIVEFEDGTGRRAARISVEQIDAAKTVEGLVVPVCQRVRGPHIGGDGENVGAGFCPDSV